jgi:hypothetical protein
MLNNEQLWSTLRGGNYTERLTNCKTKLIKLCGFVATHIRTHAVRKNSEVICGTEDRFSPPIVDAR